MNFIGSYIFYSHILAVLGKSYYFCMYKDNANRGLVQMLWRISCAKGLPRKSAMNNGTDFDKPAERKREKV